MFFLVAPYVRSFKLGRFIEFEAKIEAVKSDMKEVRTETRELISTVSTVATAISASVNQNIVQIFPSSEWAQAARQEMSEALGDASEGAKQQDDVREYMNLSASEPNYALARLRMDIERELRRILDRPVSTESRSLTARSLFRTLVSEEPKYQQMRSSFDYVLEVCNAAIHGTKDVGWRGKRSGGYGASNTSRTQTREITLADRDCEEDDISMAAEISDILYGIDWLIHSTFSK